MARWTRPILMVLALVVTATPARAQTYHLHKEASLVNGANKQLKTTGPDATQTALQTVNLKNSAGNFASLIAYFETQSGVPGQAGTIQAGTTVQFSLRMKVTALPNSGSIYPHTILRLNTSTGTQFCRRGEQDGLSPLTTTLTWYTFTCTTSSAIVMTTSDRFFLEVGVWIAATVGNKNLFGELDVETNADSTVAIGPSIASLSRTNGIVGDAVTISGMSFGTSGTVRFNETAATTSSWNSTTIQTSVPAAVSPGSGPVVVTVNSLASNGVTFTALPHITTLTPATGAFAQSVTISGTTFGTTQGSSTITFNGAAASASTWSGTSIGTSVPTGATTGPVVVTVGGNASSANFTVLLPNITSLTPTGAAVAQTVTIAGTHFGATQGASTVTFNGTLAAPTSWSDTSITAPVPAGATTGPVVVTVGGEPSNGVTFTLITTGTVSGAITRATGGSALSGATVQAVLIGVVKGTATSGADGTYAITNLDPGTFDVRVLATGYSSEVRSGTVVSANATTTVNVAMLQPGSISGRVTQLDGVTPIVGAAVTVYLGPIPKGTTNTNATGDYTIAGLHPGSYTVQAANVGNRTSEQGAVVSENATTTKNFSLDGAPSGPVQYAYDALARLVQVTDPSGDSAVYHYDAVGNITAIDRFGSASGVVINGFSPTTGSGGTAVNIYGAGFSSTPSQNTVTFTGASSGSAPVISASATQLVTTAPGGLAAGPYTIGVTTPSGSATKDGFTVTSGGGAPTITGFTPGTAVSGTALTVNGTNFDTVPANNNLKVNLSPTQVTSATATALQTTVPPSATTGRVSVATPNGTAVSATYLWVAPSPYAVADIESTGSLSFGTNSVAVATANKVALRAFEGTEGHRAAINVTDVTPGTSAYVYLYGPLGTLLNSALAGPSGFVDTVDLRSTATYSLVFDPDSTATPTATLTLYDVPADFASTIVFETALTVPDGAPGQNARLTFSGTTGQRLSLEQTGPFNCFTDTTSILDPNGASIASTCGGSFLDATTPLTATGTYTVLIDPKDANHASTTVTLHNVPADATGSTTIGGAGVPLAMNTPGQNGLVTFPGTAQQVVTVHVTSNSVARGTLTLKTESGQQVGSTPWLGAGDFNLANQTLPTTGNYQIIVDPYDVFTGSLTVSVTSP